MRVITADTISIKDTARPKAEKGSRLDSKALMGLFSPFLLDTLVYTVLKLNLNQKMTFVNAAVTNVPGSPVPMYMAGARQVSVVPMAPAIDTIGLTICISSSSTQLSMGYHGCGMAIKDKELFVEGALKSFNELKKAAKLKKTTVPKQVAPKKTSVKKAAPKKAAKKKPIAQKKTPGKQSVKNQPLKKPPARKAPAKKAPAKKAQAKKPVTVKKFPTKKPTAKPKSPSR